MVRHGDERGGSWVRSIKTLTSCPTGLGQEITVDISRVRFTEGTVSGFRVQYRKWRLGPV